MDLQCSFEHAYNFTISGGNFGRIGRDYVTTASRESRADSAARPHHTAERRRGQNRSAPGSPPSPSPASPPQPPPTTHSSPGSTEDYLKSHTPSHRDDEIIFDFEAPPPTANNLEQPLLTPNVVSISRPPSRGHSWSAGTFSSQSPATPISRRRDSCECSLFEPNNKVSETQEHHLGSVRSRSSLLERNQDSHPPSIHSYVSPPGDQTRQPYSTSRLSVAPRNRASYYSELPCDCPPPPSHYDQLRSRYGFIHSRPLPAPAPGLSNQNLTTGIGGNLTPAEAVRVHWANLYSDPVQDDRSRDLNLEPVYISDPSVRDRIRVKSRLNSFSPNLRHERPEHHGRYPPGHSEYHSIPPPSALPSSYAATSHQYTLLTSAPQQCQPYFPQGDYSNLKKTAVRPPYKFALREHPYLPPAVDEILHRWDYLS